MNRDEISKKRLVMRASHRGIKEMDIILGGYVRANLDQFSQDDVAHIEAFMEINDQRLYQMILRNEPAPEAFEGLVADIISYIDKKNFT